MVRMFIVLLALAITPTVYALTEVSATIDKNPVMLKESILLTVIANDDVERNALDTSPLTRDFIVGRTSVNSQTSIVNFTSTKTTQWTTVLIPRREGLITIPALFIDSISTQPIVVKVLPAGDPTQAQQDVFITSEISAQNVYVQQQLTLTVKLHFASELKRGSLSDPTLDSASIKPIGKDKENDAIINGKRYRVIERSYAINPQQSGEFVLRSPMFSGEVMMPSTRRSNFLSFAESKPVSIIGDDIKLTVNPIPLSYKGDWLPSELLAIHQEWQPEQDTFKVGEPITRTITLTAAGLSQEQLPNLDMAMPKGLKVYPDQAELHTGLNNNKLVSQKVQNFALVASKPGEYSLPEIAIPWWNTVTNKLQSAIIPAQIITVLPNEDIAEPTAVNHNPQQGEAIQPKTIIIEKSPWLQWLFLALWILTSLAWFISAKRPFKRTENKNVTGNSNHQPHLQLMAACKQNQGEQALALLIPWARNITENNNINTIEDVIASLNNLALTNAISELQQCYYGKSTKAWQGNSLLHAITQIKKSPVVNEQNSFSLNP